MERTTDSVVLAITVAFSACFFNTATAAPVQIMCLGDSITDGTNNSRYRDRLYTRLNDAKVDFTFIGSTTHNASEMLTTAGQAHHDGHGGFTIQDINGNLDGLAHQNGDNPVGFWLTGKVGIRPALYPNIILLHIGTNNIAEGVPAMKEELDTLMERIFCLRSETTLVVAGLIPKPDADAIVTEYNNSVHSLVDIYSAAGNKCYFIDMHDKLTTADISDDGTHPRQSGYDKMGDAWFSALRTNGLVVPEPSSLSMLLVLGTTLLVLAWRHRNPYQPGEVA